MFLYTLFWPQIISTKAGELLLVFSESPRALPPAAERQCQPSLSFSHTTTLSDNQILSSCHHCVAIVVIVIPNALLALDAQKFCKIHFFA